MICQVLSGFGPSRLFIVLSLLLPGVTRVQAAEQNEIGSIQTAGNRNVSSAQILSKVRSRVGEIFDSTTAAEDADRIGKLPGVAYAYYNTTVVDDKVQLIFVVGERDIVRSIAFVGNRAYKAGTLRDKLTFKVGDWLDVILAETCRTTLVEFYRRKGFAFVEVALDDEQLSAGKVIYTIDEGPRVKVASVKFSGNKAIKTGALKKVVKTKEKKWLFWPGYYIEQQVGEEVTRLQKIYYDKGFLDASVTAKREFNADKSKIRITFVIEEGPVYTIEKIVFVGNEQFDESQLRAELKLEQGQVYSERDADSDTKRLFNLYREGGFINAKVEQSVKFVSEDKVSVEFEIREGERFRIGQINITGNEYTQDKVVRRILDEYDFQPGQWYNADIARGDGSGELERTIQRVVLTERDGATINPSGEMPGQRDAQVNIVEGRTGMVMVGAGVSSDIGVMGQVVFDQRNFDISDWPESFGEFITGNAFKGAGQSLRIAMQPGTEVSTYSINFTEPYFQDRPIALDVIGSGLRWYRECYDEGRTKGYVGLEKRYKNRWRRSVGFRLENVDVDSVDYDAPNEIKDVEGDNALVGIRIGMGRNLTDSRYNPSAGYSFSASYEQFSGDHTFGIFSGVYRWYKTLYEDLAERKTVLGTKLLAATAVDDAPPFEKFYAGGTGSYGIRGFEYRGVSTRGRNTVTGELDDPIGSDWIFLANAEVTVPLIGENFAGLLFIDSGVIDSGNYRVGAGTGIQIMIPQWFGPVPMRFEFASPVMKDDEDETQVFSFSIGRLF